MPDDFNDDDVVGDEDQPKPRDFRRLLNDEQSRNRTLAEENRILAREVAFTKAKLPESPQVKFFRDHYTGEFTPEAIRQSALDAGFIEQGPPASEVRDLHTMEEAVSGGMATIPQGSRDAMYEEMRQVSGADAPFKIDAILRKYGQPTASDNR